MCVCVCVATRRQWKIREQWRWRAEWMGSDSASSAVTTTCQFTWKRCSRVVQPTRADFAAATESWPSAVCRWTAWDTTRWSPCSTRRPSPLRSCCSRRHAATGLWFPEYHLRTVAPRRRSAVFHSAFLFRPSCCVNLYVHIHTHTYAFGEEAIPWCHKKT